MKNRHTLAILACVLCLTLLLPALLMGCQEKPTALQNEVLSVKADGNGHITVTAALTQGFLDTYVENKVYLFEIPAAYAAEVDLEELDPVAELRPKAELRFKISAFDGVRSRLYSSFLVASYDATARRYKALTYPKSVTDLSALARSSHGVVADRSIKGLISDHPTDAIRLGAAHTIVEVPMESLILGAWQEGVESYVWNGATAYLNGQALAALDEQVHAYASAGVNVYLRFVLGEATEQTPRCLYFLKNMTSVGQARAYAVNMTDAQTVEIMEGFFDFMADRYASPEGEDLPVLGFILGDRVNHESVCNFAGLGSLDEYVTNYEKLVRIANTAIKSHAATGRVYVSLDSARMVQNTAGHWDIPAFLSAFNSVCVKGGNYDWHPACELYTDTASVWVANAGRDASYYTVQSLSTLTDLLAGDVYRTPGGQARKLLISRVTVPAVPMGETASSELDLCQAASYAYAYMTCVENGSVEALIYGEYADGAVLADTRSLCGIWKITETQNADQTETYRVITEKRPLYDTFRLIDTSEADTLSDGLTAVIGEPFTKLNRLLVGGIRPVNAVTGQSEILTSSPLSGKNQPLFKFDDGSLHGFRDAGQLTYMELKPVETLNASVLYARFDREAICDHMGIAVTVPATKLMGGEELFFELYAGEVKDPDAASDAATRQKPTVTLRLTRASKGRVADGDGTVLYEASVSQVKNGVWQTVAFDVESFTELLEYDDEVTLTLLLDYPDDGEFRPAHELGIAGIYIRGNTAAPRTSPWIVMAVVAALIVVVIGGFILLLVRHRRRR